MTAAKKPEDIFFVDPAAPEHPKFARLKKHPLRHEATALWFTAGCWAKRYKTDGRVTLEVVLANGFSEAAARALVSPAELWVEIPGGWMFHDWFDHQPRGKAKTKKQEQMALFNVGVKCAPPIAYAVMGSYAKLYQTHYGTSAPEPTPAHKRAAIAIGAWCDKNAGAQKLFPERLADVLMAGLFASQDAAEKGFPLPFVAANPMRFLQPVAPKPVRKVGPAPVPSREEYELAAAGGESCF